jgi:hypothetical protein
VFREWVEEMAKAEQSMDSERGGGGGAAAAARAEKVERRGRLEPIVLSVDLCNPLNMAVTLEEVRTKAADHTYSAPLFSAVHSPPLFLAVPRLQHTGVLTVPFFFSCVFASAGANCGVLRGCPPGLHCVPCWVPSSPPTPWVR